MVDCNEKFKRSEEGYKTHFYDKEKQESLDHLPECMKVLREFYINTEQKHNSF